MRARANMFARARTCVCDSAALPVCSPPGVSPAQSWHFNPCSRDCTKASLLLPHHRLFSLSSFLPFFPPSPSSSPLRACQQSSPGILFHTPPLRTRIVPAANILLEILSTWTLNLCDLSPLGDLDVLYAPNRGASLVTGGHRRS